MISLCSSNSHPPSKHYRFVMKLLCKYVGLKCPFSVVIRHHVLLWFGHLCTSGAECPSRLRVIHRTGLISTLTSNRDKPILQSITMISKFSSLTSLWRYHETIAITATTAVRYANLKYLLGFSNTEGI